jgi:hypothetical protein
MDLDLGDVPAHVVRDKVGAILEATPFRQALASAELAIEHVTEHKQTETTQRWKIGLQVPCTSSPVPTKVEFSRRGIRDPAVLDRVTPMLLHAYRMPAFMAPHYPGEVALRHKIEALATRGVTQARDVFDVYLMHSEERMQAVRSRIDAALLKSALHNALALTYDDFQGQVLAYLETDDQAAYGTRESWETMQLSVIDALEQADEID